MLKQESNLASDEVVDSEKRVIDARAEAMFKEKRAAIMKFLFTFYRDMFVLKLGCDEEFVINKNFLSEIKFCKGHGPVEDVTNPRGWGEGGAIFSFFL